MALTGVSSHLQATFDAGDPVPFTRNSIAAFATATSQTVETSFWFQSNGFPGVGSIPPVGAGEACDRNTPGAIPLPSPSAGKKTYLNQATLITSGQCVFKYYDRLVHTSGLSGTVAGSEQPVGTAALPARAGTGRLVIPFLEVYVATGTTAINSVTMRYTNSAGAPNKTAVTATVNLNGIGRFIPLNLAPGDVGVQSVEGITLGLSTGAPSGNFGITLAKLITWQPASGSNFLAYPQNPTEQGGANIDDNACLMIAGHYQAAVTGMVAGQFQFIQG